MDLLGSLSNSFTASGSKGPGRTVGPSFSYSVRHIFVPTFLLFIFTLFCLPFSVYYYCHYYLLLLLCGWNGCVKNE